MRMLVLQHEYNKKLFNELKLEFIKTEYMYFVNRLFNLLELNISEDSDMAKEINYNTLLIVNKIILDNLFNYGINNDAITFTHLIQNKLITKNLYIKHTYIEEIIIILKKYLIINEIDKHEIEIFINKNLLSFIDIMYVSNVDKYNIIFIELFYKFNTEMSFMNVGYFRFEIDHFYRPILIFSEKEQNACISA